MPDVISLQDRGFSFLKGVFQYSAGAAAAPGFRFERVRFQRPVPLSEGFAEIERHLQRIGRPITALCACELRSPKPMSEDEFAQFNRAYVGQLSDWGILHEGDNPIARTNVCPHASPPATPSFYAFNYSVADSAAKGLDFIIAGSGECPEGKSNYRDHIVRLGDVTDEAMKEKARWVLKEMERRMGAFGYGWEHVSGTQMYTVHDVGALVREDFAERGAISCGLNWHFARPPIAELEFEMDARRVSIERIA